MNYIKSTLLVCILFFILPANSKALELTPELVQSWEEKTNMLGSPNGYMYIAGKGKVEVYSSTQNRVLTKKLSRNEKVYTSPSGNYWGVAKFVDKTALSLVVTRFTMYNPSGSFVYSLEKPPVLRFILNDETPVVVGVEGTEGLPLISLHFYDESGTAVNIRKITNYMGGDFTKDGEKFYAFSADSGIYIFNKYGEPDYRIKSSRSFALSDDGRLLMSVLNGNLNLYLQKNLMNSVDIDLDDIREILITDDKKSGVVLCKSRAVCYELPKLEVLWSYELDESREHFSSCDFNSDMNSFIFGIAHDNGPEFSFSDRYNNGRICVLDKDGKLIGSGNIEYKSWSKGFPRVEFPYAGEYFWVITHYDLFKTPLN